jgi:hypothetical protein
MTYLAGSHVLRSWPGIRVKAVGQPLSTAKKPLGNAQRLLESLWAFLKVYWKAGGKCPILAVSQ